MWISRRDVDNPQSCQLLNGTRPEHGRVRRSQGQTCAWPPYPYLKMCVVTSLDLFHGSHKAEKHQQGSKRHKGDWLQLFTLLKSYLHKGYVILKLLWTNNKTSVTTGHYQRQWCFYIKFFLLPNIYTYFVNFNAKKIIHKLIFLKNLVYKKILIQKRNFVTRQYDKKY